MERTSRISPSVFFQPPFSLVLARFTDIYGQITMKMTTRTLLNGVALSGATLAMAFGSVDRAQAAAITLGNTGAGTYSVSGGGSTTIVPNGAFPIGPWFDNDATSSWIGSTSLAPGDYTYSTTFDLAGLNAATASIAGGWAGDNSGVSILLNGSATGITANAGGVNFASFTGFTIDNTANFTAGLNTLSFTINNANDPNNPGNNATGLRVAMTGNADVATTEVPEPSDFVGTAFAFGSVVLLKRKMSKKKLG
jgi:hypothetical protein